MKKRIKIFLERINLLEFSQRINYLLSKYNKNSRHPRRKIIRFYQLFIKKGYLVFDIGANIGERVSIFDELEANIIAVEPQRNCVEQLYKKFGAKSNIKIENIGLGDKKGELEFFICEDDDRLSTFSTDQIKNSFFSKNTKWQKKEIIKVERLDDLIDKFGCPQFIKIDVEGFEVNVLKGLSRKVPFLSFEFSSIKLDKVEDCIKLLLKLDPNFLFNVCFGEPYKMYFEKPVKYDKVLSEINRQSQLVDTHTWGDIYAVSVENG